MNLIVMTTASADETAAQLALVRFTGWLVGVGALQFIAMVGQAIVYWRTLKTINRQVLVNQEQVELTRDASMRALRAYVNVSAAIVRFIRPDAPEVQVRFKNSGQTPAYDLRLWIHIWIEQYPLRTVLPEPPPEFRMSSNVLESGGTTTMVRQTKPPVAAPNVHLIGTPEGTMYVYGKLSYKDVYGVQRTTEYRLMYGGPESGRTFEEGGLLCGLLSPDVEGNSST